MHARLVKWVLFLVLILHRLIMNYSIQIPLLNWKKSLHPAVLGVVLRPFLGFLWLSLGHFFDHLWATLWVMQSLAQSFDHLQKVSASIVSKFVLYTWVWRCLDLFLCLVAYLRPIYEQVFGIISYPRPFFERNWHYWYKLLYKLIAWASHCHPIGQSHGQ